MAAFGECFGTVDECFDFEGMGRRGPNDTVGLLYTRSLPGCGSASDRAGPDCQGGRGHNRWSNCTDSADGCYWYGNVVLGYNWRMPQVIGTRRAVVAYNAVLFRGERSTTFDESRDGSRGEADLIGNVYADGPQSKGAQIRSDTGNVSVYMEGNVACDPAGNCRPATVEEDVTAARSRCWPEAEFPPIAPQELLSETYFRERIGPGYMTPIGERIWQRYGARDLEVGGDYEPTTFSPTPMRWTAPSDRDGDGIPDTHDRRAEQADPWADDDGDGWPNLVEYQDGTLPPAAAGASGSSRP